ncbi:MAG: hypothetical protein AAF066_16370 [Pseudomonadota bacterium]
MTPRLVLITLRRIGLTAAFLAVYGVVVGGGAFAFASFLDQFDTPLGVVFTPAVPILAGFPILIVISAIDAWRNDIARPVFIPSSSGKDRKPPFEGAESVPAFSTKGEAHDHARSQKAKRLFPAHERISRMAEAKAQPPQHERSRGD